MARERRALLRGDRERARISLSITPMIDVVFQLLIYFLLTAGIVSNERNPVLYTHPPSLTNCKVQYHVVARIALK